MSANQVISVIMGGPSREHEISLLSGKAITNGLDQQKYQVLQVVISKSGEWSLEGQPAATGQVLRQLADQQATAFIALHGTFGEDGTLQALLERFNIPYTGSGVAASLLAMNKVTSNDLYRDAGLQVPRSLAIHHAEDVVAGQILDQLGLPVVIKPSQQGSSVGVHVVREQTELETALQDAFTYDDTVIAQEFIEGRELSCGVLEQDGDLVTLPPTEIIPVVSDFFDYKAKYTQGGSKEVTPAQVDEATTQAVQAVALRAHQVLGCSGYSRTDVIVNDQGMYIIETNTLPGMTELSILPAQAKAAGLSFGELLDTMIASAQITK